MEIIEFDNATITITDREDGDVKTKDSPLLGRFQHRYQIHSDKIYVHTEEYIDNSNEITADAIITKTTVPIAVKIADCNGIVLIGKDHVAVIHAWRRWLQQHIITKTIEKLWLAGENISQLQVYVWPAIWSCCFEVWPEFIEFFPKQHLIERDNKLFLDMKKVIIDELKKCWINGELVTISETCTKCSGKYFSYRWWDIQQRFLIWVQKKSS